MLLKWSKAVTTQDSLLLQRTCTRVPILSALKARGEGVGVRGATREGKHNRPEKVNRFQLRITNGIERERQIRRIEET